MKTDIFSQSKLPLTWTLLVVNVFLVLALTSVWKPLKIWSPSFVRHHKESYEFVDPKKVFENRPVDLLNASAVFNTVGGAGKQKSANIFPVGVSFIPAYLPANTLMYHSTWSPNIPDLFEWIAMDYEFSYSFAGFRRGKESGGPPPPKHPPDFDDKDADKKPPAKGPWFDRDRPSFLFTFRNTEPLDRLIFLDGASAAKSSTGEMDQQLVLSRQEDELDRVDERIAADKICKWGKLFGLQGYVRMEIGYEIVLCSFFDKVELVSNVTLSNVTDLGNLPWENPKPKDELEAKRLRLVDSWQAMTGYDWLASGANVNDGERRILLDFAGMVTPLNSTWIDPDPYKRRMSTLSHELKEGLISQLEDYLKEPVNPFEKTNWQLIIEHISVKFGPILVLLNNTLTVYELESQTLEPILALENAVGNLTRLTYNIARRYVNDGLQTTEEQRQSAMASAIADYVHHNFPLKTNLEILIYSSIYKVAYEVLGTLFDIFFEAREMLPDLFVAPTDARFDQFHQSLAKRKETLGQLLDTLSWSLFTQCTRKCGWDEICYVPTRGPSPLGWGASNNGQYFEYYDDRYRVPKNIQCVSYRNMGAFNK